MEETSNAEEKNDELKIVVIGDGAVGKTSLCAVFASKKFPETYEPTVFETHPTKMTVFDKVLLIIIIKEKVFITKSWKEYNVNVWDTAGQEEYENIRKYDIYFLLGAKYKNFIYMQLIDKDLKKDLTIFN